MRMRRPCFVVRVRRQHAGHRQIERTLSCSGRDPRHRDRQHVGQVCGTKGFRFPGVRKSSSWPINTSSVNQTLTWKVCNCPTQCAAWILRSLACSRLHNASSTTVLLWTPCAGPCRTRFRFVREVAERRWPAPVKQSCCSVGVLLAISACGPCAKRWRPTARVHRMRPTHVLHIISWHHDRSARLPRTAKANDCIESKRNDQYLRTDQTPIVWS